MSLFTLRSASKCMSPMVSVTLVCGRVPYLPWLKLPAMNLRQLTFSRVAEISLVVLSPFNLSTISKPCSTNASAASSRADAKATLYSGFSFSARLM